MITGQTRGDNIVIDNKPADAAQYNPEPSAVIYYEVVRLIDSRFLFLNDHLKRLEKSLNVVGLSYPGDDVIRQSLRILIESNNILSGNIKILVHTNNHDLPKVIAHFVSHFYPTDTMYSEGVDLLTFRHTRPLPGIKKWDGDFRNRVNGFIRDHQIYEAILVNEFGCITEGSRSNIFFIDSEDHILTAPLDFVLPGITRRYVLDIIRQMKIQTSEEIVCTVQLEDYKACFISGTSPKVLPVRTLDNKKFDVYHPLLRVIREEFESMVNQSLKVI